MDVHPDVQTYIVRVKMILNRSTQQSIPMPESMMIPNMKNGN